MADNAVTAIVIADDHYNGLGVIRSLGEKGIHVNLILLNTGKTVIDHSKYVTVLKKTEHNRESIIKTINELVAGDKQYVLFPLSDYAAEILDEIHTKYNDNVIIPNSDGRMRTLMNKHYLSETFRTCGVNVPEHIIYGFNNQPLKWEKYPAIIKPLASVEGLKSDIITANNDIELFRALNQFELKGYTQVLIEEFISGKDEFMIEIMGYIDKSGSPHFSDVVHKIREYPINNGSTAFAYFEREPQYINFECLKKAVRSTGYTGIFDIEFKYANGKAYFIEMNFRNGAPSYAVTRRGMNIPYEWFCSQIGSYPTQSRRSNRIYFMCEHRDVLNMLKKNVSAKQWLRDYRRSDKLIWNWKDVIPSIKLYCRVVKTAFRRLVHG